MNNFFQDNALSSIKEMAADIISDIISDIIEDDSEVKPIKTCNN